MRFPVFAVAAPLVLTVLCTRSVHRSATDNVVLRWNQATIDAIRITRTPPPIAARAFAIIHTCMFDAWAAYDDKALGTRLSGSLRQPEGERTLANKQKAVSFATYQALVDLFPSQKTTQFDPMMNELGYDSDDISTDTNTPSGIGNVACKAVLDFRHADGSNQLGDLHAGAYSDYTNYAPANTATILKDPDRWQPLLFNGVPQRWQLPQWGLIKPFGLTSGSQFRDYVISKGPLTYPSSAYWKQTLDIVALSAQLGDREKVIAEYWADGSGTVTPPGHWSVFAQDVSRRDQHTLDQDAKLFFILGNALMDSSIAAWDAKRCTDSIRPISVIRVLMGAKEIHAWAGPGLGTRVIYGKDFRSYLPTPPFSSYISAHSVFSAAAAEILKRFTGSNYFGESYAALPGSSVIEPGLTPSVEVTLSWRTFWDAADQAGMSRRYGGIHFENDDLVGRELGRLVANEVWVKAMAHINGTAP